MSEPVCQQAITDFCKDLRTQPFVKEEDSVDCWFETFNEWLLSNGEATPIQDAYVFDAKLYQWATTTREGQFALNQF